MINVKELYKSIFFIGDTEYENIYLCISNAKTFRFKGNLWIEKKHNFYIAYKSEYGDIHCFNPDRKFINFSGNVSKLEDSCYKFKYLEDAVNAIQVCQK